MPRCHSCLSKPWRTLWEGDLARSVGGVTERRDGFVGAIVFEGLLAWLRASAGVVCCWWLEAVDMDVLRLVGRVSSEAPKMYSRLRLGSCVCVLVLALSLVCR